ncbi:MAG: hypothetical protein R3316_11710 [Rhodovibrionaceae bacterium]|nr:hypothetical protein [Rhodovibrionaceae bacterium]
MGFASSFARILGGATMLGLALYFFGEGKIAWREGIDLQADLDPESVLLVIAILGLFGVMTLADGMFKLLNKR